MNETLIRWIAEGATAAEIVTRGAGFGRINPADTEGLTGQQILEAMMAGRLPVPLNAAHEAFVVLHAGDGKSMLQAMPQEAHLNPMGTAHGGWLTTLMDTCMGNAVMSMLPVDRVHYATTQVFAEFLRPVPADIVCVRCQAEINWRKNTSTTMHAISRIIGADGSAYALGEGYFRVSRKVLC